MLLWCDVAEHGGTVPADHRGADGARDVVITGSDVGCQRSERVERRFVSELELKVHVLFYQVHGDVPRTFDHDLAVVLPGDLRQFSERSEFSQLCVVIRIRNGAWTKAVTEAERTVVCTHDLADFFVVRIEAMHL